MKKKLLIIFLIFQALNSNAQIVIDTSVVSFLYNYPNVSIVPIARDTSYWNSETKAEILFSENYYKDWNAGGDNFINGLFKFDWHAIYNKGNVKWDNILKVEYGMNRQEDRDARKTNDLFEYNGNYGYKVVEKWYASTQLRFTTQFSEGYDYKDDGNHVLKSSFFAPAKIFFGGGAKFTRNDDFYIYMSPFTANMTFVFNDSLAKKGDINKNGEMFYNKIGPWVDVFWKYNFYRDYYFVNKISVYSDYVHQFGSIDYFDWQLDVSVPLHKYFTLSFGFQMKYEKDVLFDVPGSTTGEKETRIQFKQVLGIGLKYIF
ncbi:MAG: DUF3078 domain-containing protein [Flavobacteriales bacterium]|nr:DUF3078 domain-containing protein [Flavobacteriales bacterium]